MRMGNLLIYSVAKIFSIWPRALPRCRPSRGSPPRSITHGNCLLQKIRVFRDFRVRVQPFTPMEIQMTVGPSTQCYAGLELTTIDHVQLAIPPGSEDDCRRFYVNVLGLAEKPKPPVLSARGGLWLTAGAVEIHLGVERDFHPAKKAHPAFRVRNLDQLCARLTEAGYPPVWDTEIPGVRRFYVSDNLGNRLEFIAE